MSEVHLSGTLVCRDATEAAVVTDHLEQHIAATRAEAGYVSFDVVRSEDDPLTCLVDERFRDDAAFRVHQRRTADSKWGRVTAAIERKYAIDTDPAAVVRAHLDAFSAHDLDAILATLAPDADFVTGTTRVDPADFGEFFGWAMRELDPTMTITTLVAQDRRVACEFTESITIDGARRHLTRAAFFTVDGGLVTSVKVYDEGE